MPAYHSIFDHGNHVLIAGHDRLNAFKDAWKWHHPLSDRQLLCAGRPAFVDDVMYYHGGDVLYTLFEYRDSGEKVPLPGIWLEEVLAEAPVGWKRTPASDVLEVVTEERNQQPVVVVKNKNSGIEYLVARNEAAELNAKSMAIVFASLDVHNAARKYGFQLDFKPDLRAI